ncbi:hypothetical protein NRIC_02400 [Enterococcus florum]|uniref:Uncharacterized protein n=1 Tax=Enterococcus florum TaxID=2480627 RepID=A0A4V0WP22_9ENTE|nr:hypothetical protein NRIC_02400 [Enterococcus florum]
MVKKDAENEQRGQTSTNKKQQALMKQDQFFQWGRTYFLFHKKNNRNHKEKYVMKL